MANNEWEIPYIAEGKDELYSDKRVLAMPVRLRSEAVWVIRKNNIRYGEELESWGDDIHFGFTRDECIDEDLKEMRDVYEGVKNAIKYAIENGKSAFKFDATIGSWNSWLSRDWHIHNPWASIGLRIISHEFREARQKELEADIIEMENKLRYMRISGEL